MLIKESEIKGYIKEELRNIKRRKSFLHEIGMDSGQSTVKGKTFINVDIQEAYQSGFNFNRKWGAFLNKIAADNWIVFLYNGPEVGGPNENEYRYWLEENGVDPEVIDNAKFFDKGYAFFRYCMDEGIDDQSIVNLIKFMMTNNINDSRDLTKQNWVKFVKTYGNKDIRDLMEHAGDMINIPDLIEYLRPLNNIVVTGGGVNECLKEVEIALMALNKPYTVYSAFTY